MGLIGFIIVIIVIGFFFDDKLGTSCLTGGLSILFGIGIIVAAFAVNPILGIIVLIIVISGWKKNS